MTIELAKELIRCRSITPDDAGCQELVAKRLQRAGFKAERLRCEDVDNIWLSHGSGAPVFAFLGHTDVVPTGPVSEWRSDPFTPTERDGFLFGRGAADMKGSVAAMTAALARFASVHTRHPGTVALLLTSDEEGTAVNGTRRMLDHLLDKGLRIKYCLVGEPSSRETIGDVIKNGRRGTLTGQITISGIQGHVAYPQLADNPIHGAAPALAELCATEWDTGNEFYPPTSFQISNVHAGTGADNVIPGSVEILCNFRFSTAVTEQELKDRVDKILNGRKLRYRIDWRPAGQPFLTPGGPLLDAVRRVIRKQNGKAPEVNTAGGTSDGRFVAPTGAEIVELGPVNRTIHKVDECVSIQDLETLSTMYERILEELMKEAVHRDR